MPSSFSGAKRKETAVGGLFVFSSLYFYCSRISENCTPSNFGTTASSEALHEHQVATGLIGLGKRQPGFVGRERQTAPPVRRCLERYFSDNPMRGEIEEINTRLLTEVGEENA